MNSSLAVSTLNSMHTGLKILKNQTYAGDLQTLKMNNFEVGDYYICNSIEKIEEALKTIENKKYEVAIDGAVLKLNQKEILGTKLAIQQNIRSGQLLINTNKKVLKQIIKQKLSSRLGVLVK